MDLLLSLLTRSDFSKLRRENILKIIPLFIKKKKITRHTLFLFFISLFILFIYFWLCWVFVAARGLSLVVARGAYSLLRCPGFSLRWLLLLQSMNSRHVGSVVVVHGLGCSTARGIFPDQGLNPCPLHWQADS